MESKELNEILNKTRRTPNISLTPEQVEEIIKDLEVLEILKKWFIENIENYSFSKYPHYWVKTDYIYDNEPIFNIIKEWLENENKNNCSFK